MSTFLARRLRFEDFKSFHALRQISLARLYLVFTFMISYVSSFCTCGNVSLIFFSNGSWLYLVLAGVLVLSIGLDKGHRACETSIFLSITLYSGSKLFVYLFLGKFTVSRRLGLEA